MLECEKIIALLKSGASTLSIDCASSDEAVLRQLVLDVAEPLELLPFVWDAGDYLARIQVERSTDPQKSPVLTEHPWDTKGAPDDPQVKKLLVWVRSEAQRQLEEMKTFQERGRQNRSATKPKGYLIIIRDLFEYLNGPNGSVGYQRLVQKAFHAILRSPSKVVVLQNGEKTPEILQDTVVELANNRPKEDEVRQVFRDRVQSMATSARTSGSEFSITLTSEDEERIVRSLTGMTLDRVSVCTQYACRTLNGMTPEAIKIIQQWKRDAYRAKGIQYASPADVVPQGMDAVISWARKRRALLKPTAQDWNVPFPSGVLLVGPPGTGKTLVAKALGAEWGLDTLVLPLGELFDKFQGETEKQIKAILRAAEDIAPCQILIDEFDKAFSQSSNDDSSETTKRVLSILLTWFSEKTAPIFVCATANRPWGIKPELIRRFSKVVYVPLPDQDVRASIFKVQLEKSKIFLGAEDIERLAFLSRNFSGDEIRKIAIECASNAFADGRLGSDRLLVTIDELVEETERTTPQSNNNQEEIDQLERWAERLGALTSNDKSLTERLVGGSESVLEQTASTATRSRRGRSAVAAR